MKRLWYVSYILVGIIIVAASTLVHLSYVHDQMQVSLNEISDALEAQKSDQILDLIAAFQTQWEKNESVMVRYIHHEALDAMTGAIARLPALARYEEYGELAAGIEEIRSLLQHVYESELPVWRNIF